MSNSSQTRTCPECEGQLRADGGETVCSTCGLVVAEDQLDRGPEWHSFEADTRERTGAPLTRSWHDRGLSTVIGRGSDQLSGRKRRQLARLRRHHNRAKIGSKAERNQVYAFTEIRRITSSLSLPDSTRDRACMFFERAQEQDLLRGRSVEGFAAAALYAACRVSGLSRTMRELAAVARASPSELQVAYDAMNRDLGLPTGPIDLGEYIPASPASSTCRRSSNNGPRSTRRRSVRKASARVDIRLAWRPPVSMGREGPMLSADPGRGRGRRRRDARDAPVDVRGPAGLTPPLRDRRVI